MMPPNFFNRFDFPVAAYGALQEPMSALQESSTFVGMCCYWSSDTIGTNSFFRYAPPGKDMLQINTVALSPGNGWKRAMGSGRFMSMNPTDLMTSLQMAQLLKAMGSPGYVYFGCASCC